MKITSKLGSDNRHMGGYCGTPVSSFGASFYYTIYAKIPVGYSIDMYNNEIGDGAHKYWLTGNKGTGEWQWYIGVTECGASGLFGTLGYVAIYANDECTNTNADNIVWYVGYSQVASYQPTTKSNTETRIEMEYNGHTYQVIAESLSWEQAKVRAEELGGHLVTITSEKENGIVKHLFANSGLRAVWLGASDSEVEGKWQWVTGEEIIYSEWGQPAANSWEPNGENNENYLALVFSDTYLNGKYRWNDFPNLISTVTGYIVEFDY